MTGAAGFGQCREPGKLIPLYIRWRRQSNFMQRCIMPSRLWKRAVSYAASVLQAARRNRTDLLLVPLEILREPFLQALRQLEPGLVAQARNISNHCCRLTMTVGNSTELQQVFRRLCRPREYPPNLA